MGREIRFKFAPKKAWAAIHWMVSQTPGIDLHTLLKACYFADKKHLNEYSRPVFGAVYRAMRYGPVPLEVYEMAKGEAYWLAEMRQNRYPWTMDGFHLHLESNAPVDTDALSPSDMEALEFGMAKSCSMTFNDRTAATHGPDWQAADLGTMRYEDMIEESPNKQEIVNYLRENSTKIRM